MAKVKVVIESDEAIKVRVTKQPNDEVAMDKIRADMAGMEAKAMAGKGGEVNATENA